MDTKTFTCIECYDVIEVDEERDEDGNVWYDLPDECESCGEEFVALEDMTDDGREDFHSDI